jgi:hypothetical protein
MVRDVPPSGVEKSWGGRFDDSPNCPDRERWQCFDLTPTSRLIFVTVSAGGIFCTQDRLGFLGLTMPHFFRLKAMGAVEPSKDVNCIHLMLVGGPSQLDTWDMKPDAPASIRGPFKPIKTNVSGIEFGDLPSHGDPCG